MENRFPHLVDLRLHAADARRAAVEVQSSLSRTLRGGAPVSEDALLAAQALMQLSDAAQSLYLREVMRCNSAVLRRGKETGRGA